MLKRNINYTYFKIKNRKNRNTNKYNNSNKTELKISSDVRGQYLYSSAKPRGFTICVVQ